MKLDMKKTEGFVPANGNSFLELAKARKTTYEFGERKVREEDLLTILEAGRWAPSCSNMQPWLFIVITEKQKVVQLTNICTYGSFHTPPPVLIALVLNSDCYKVGPHRCVASMAISTDESYLCMGMAAMSMVLEAQALGLDSAVMTPHQVKAGEILKVRERDLVLLLICLGYERRGAFQRQRTRKELHKIVFQESFRKKMAGKHTIYRRV